MVHSLSVVEDCQTSLLEPRTSFLRSLETVELEFASEYAVYDLPSDGEVVHKLKDLRSARVTRPPGLPVLEFGQLYYGESLAGEGSSTGEQALTLEEAVIIDEHLLLCR